MRIVYAPKKFSAGSLRVISQANEILDDYAAQGFDLTLRQLYYQFVSRDLIRNKDTEYKRLGSIVNDARMAGYIDWNRIVDRTRNLRSLGHWRDPAQIIRATATSFLHDKWKDQPYRVEVWIEKDALVGVIEDVCEELDVPYFSCRGYTSQSEMWRAAQRLGSYIEANQKVKIIHLGDHDPSGIDMSRDIEERLFRFLAQDHFNDAEGIEGWEAAAYIEDRFSLERVALNMDQIDLYGPPPNPAKLTDSRGSGYVERFGYESWELDALEPTVIRELIEDAVFAVRDVDAWQASSEREKKEQQLLQACTDRWAEVADFLTK